MDFDYTDEQTMLADSIGRFLADRYDFAQRQAAVHSAEGWRPEIWRALAEDIGLLGAPFEEPLGGLGQGPVGTMIVMEALGHALAAEPFFDTVVLCGGLLRRDGGPRARAVIERIIAGKAILALAYSEPETRYDLADVTVTARRQADGWRLDGAKDAVSAAPWADTLIVSARTSGARRDRDGISLFLVDRDTAGVSLNAYATVDEGRAADVVFAGVSVGADALVGPEGGGLDLLEMVADEACAALCAEAVGAMRRVHAETLEYARQRRQFGVPIASFQVLQHRMVDMYIAIEQAVSMTYMATIKLNRPHPERARAASAAKVQVAKAARFVGQSAIQIHGGMGMTDELSVSHYFKRLTVIESLFGGVDHHLDRYEALSLEMA